MAAVTINISEQQAARLTEMAKAEGLTLEGWFHKIVEQNAPSTSIAHLQQEDPEEWIRQFKEFLASQRSTVVLSDEAMSRESIYFGDD